MKFEIRNTVLESTFCLGKLFNFSESLLSHLRIGDKMACDLQDYLKN